VISPTQGNPPDHIQQSKPHPYPRLDSNPPSQQASALDRTATGIDITQYFLVLFVLINDTKIRVGHDEDHAWWNVSRNKSCTKFPSVYWSDRLAAKTGLQLRLISKH